MRIIFSILVASISVIGGFAQGFFDDKKIEKPVPHMSAYNNDEWHLEGIRRTNDNTVFLLRYTTPYRGSGWMNIVATESVIDSKSGKLYPLINAAGIPKEPQRYVWENPVNDVNMQVLLTFGPIPENVTKVQLGTSGLYDIEIGRVPITANGVTTYFNSKNETGTLTLDAINDNGEYTSLYFTYMPNSNKNNTICANETAMLKDRDSDKTFSLVGYIGLPSSPEKLVIPYKSYDPEENRPIGFSIVFPSLSAAGVKNIDFICGDWSISNISL